MGEIGHAKTLIHFLLFLRKETPWSSSFDEFKKGSEYLSNILKSNIASEEGSFYQEPDLTGLFLVCDQCDSDKKLNSSQDWSKEEVGLKSLKVYPKFELDLEFRACQALIGKSS